MHMGVQRRVVGRRWKAASGDEARDLPVAPGYHPAGVSREPRHRLEEEVVQTGWRLRVEVGQQLGEGFGQQLGEVGVQPREAVQQV